MKNLGRRVADIGPVIGKGATPGNRGVCGFDGAVVGGVHGEGGIRGDVELASTLIVDVSGDIHRAAFQVYFASVGEEACGKIPAGLGEGAQTPHLQAAGLQGTSLKEVLAGTVQAVRRQPQQVPDPVVAPGLDEGSGAVDPNGFPDGPEDASPQVVGADSASVSPQDQVTGKVPPVFLNKVALALDPDHFISSREQPVTLQLITAAAICLETQVEVAVHEIPSPGLNKRAGAGITYILPVSLQVAAAEGIGGRPGVIRIQAEVAAA